MKTNQIEENYILINIHSLRGDERGFEASTRTLKHYNGGFGTYYVASGETESEAISELAEQIGCSPKRLQVVFRG